VLCDIERRYFPGHIFVEKAEEIKESDVINGVAALCANFISNSQVLESQLKDWLSTGQGGCIQSIGLRRALLAAFSERKGERLLFCKTKRSPNKLF
jgi:telomere length regulation protein